MYTSLSLCLSPPSCKSPFPNPSCMCFFPHCFRHACSPSPFLCHACSWLYSSLPCTPLSVCSLRLSWKICLNFAFVMHTSVYFSLSSCTLVAVHRLNLFLFPVYCLLLPCTRLSPYSVVCTIPCHVLTPSSLPFSASPLRYSSFVSLSRIFLTSVMHSSVRSLPKSCTSNSVSYLGHARFCLVLVYRLACPSLLYASYSAMYIYTYLLIFPSCMPLISLSSLSHARFISLIYVLHSSLSPLLPALSVMITSISAA